MSQVETVYHVIQDRPRIYTPKHRAIFVTLAFTKTVKVSQVANSVDIMKSPARPVRFRVVNVLRVARMSTSVGPLRGCVKHVVPVSTATEMHRR